MNVETALLLRRGGFNRRSLDISGLIFDSRRPMSSSPSRSLRHIVLVTVNMYKCLYVLKTQIHICKLQLKDKGPDYLFQREAEIFVFPMNWKFVGGAKNRCVTLESWSLLDTWLVGFFEIKMGPGTHSYCGSLASRPLTKK